ncbi:MAG: hypothetical protein WD042_02985 [Phycisphaeraceae bacterium]
MNLTLSCRAAVCGMMVIMAIAGIEGCRPAPQSTPAAAPSPAPAATAPMALAPLRLLAPDEWSPLPPRMLGYNTNAPATAAGLPRAPWDHPKLVQAMNQLQPGALRFPGGTLSQYHNWQSEHLELPHPFGQRVTPQALAVHGNQAGFLELCRQVGASPVFTMNLLQENRPDPLAWVASLTGSDGVPAVKHWELGNEVPEVLFYKKQYAGAIKTVEDYIAAARPVGQEMLQRYPGIAVAVTAAAPIHFQQIHVPDEKPNHRQWNHALGQDRSFYNAVVHHEYLHPWLQFQAKLGWTVHRRAQWMFALGDSWPAFMAEYHRQDFGDLPLWLTEVGIVTWEKPGDDSPGETWYGRLAEFNFIVSILAQRGPVTMICKHMAAVPRAWMPIQVRTGGGQLNEARITYPTGKMFTHLGQAVYGGGQIATWRVDAGEFPGALRFKDRQYPVLKAVAIRRDDSTTLILINRGEAPLTMALPQGTWSGASFHAALDARDAQVNEQAIDLSPGQALTVQPYSFTMIQQDATRGTSP